MTTQTSTWQGEPQPPSPSQRAVPGTLIGGRYQLRVAIGNGGMGTVWQAADTLLRRDVAVKEVLLPAGMADAERTAMYERTMREARAAAALSHPSVVQVYDVVTEGGRPWIVMELLHARSLADMIIADGPLAPRAVAKIGIALLGALEVAHGAGVLHRDVKPANVLICTDGRCVLTDFGVARMPSESNLTTPGMVLGSPHFISPERAVGGAFGPPSDLFSLGVSLFTAVEGRPPFDKGDPFDTMRAVVEEPPVTPVRAGPLIPVLYGLLDKDPARRWDVTAARQTLRDLLAGPLANSAAHHVTDPYTVVPVAPAARPVYQSDSAGGQIGGRAMLAPGELPGDRSASRASTAGVVLEPTNPGYGTPGAPQSWVPPSGPPGRRRPAHGAAGGGMFADLASGVQYGSRSLLGRVRALPRPALLAIGGGLAAVLVLGVVALSGGFGGGAKQAGGAPSAAPSPTVASIPVQLYQDKRQFSLNVPAGWTQAGNSYVDFTDPKDPGRRMRVNVEPAGSTSEAFMEAVERTQKSDPNRCAAPYNRVSLTDGVTLAGHPAAELQYNCGSGADMRHIIWRATVINRQAYEFYLSVPESQFADSKPIYDAAVRSYTLNLTSPSAPA